MRPYLEELPVKEETVSTDFTEESEKVQEDYTEYLMQCKKNVNETDYFAKRGLSGQTISRFNLGYDPDKNIVTIPYNPDYKGYVHRVLWDANNKYSKHNNEIFNLNALHSDRSSHVFVCEGQIDAMSFEEAGFSAIGLGGVNEISKLIELIKKENTCNKTLIMALDNDKAGLRATGKFLEELSETKIKQRVVFDTGMYGGYKDANEFLMADRNGFAEMASSMTRK
jgi:replicative DNA helicase